jgi:hypothetical protein
MTCNQYSAQKYSIVGVDYPWLNANSAEFLSAQNELAGGQKCLYTSFGYAETNVATATKRMFDIHAPYVISPQPSIQPPPDAFNQVALPMAEYLLNSQDFAAEFVPPDDVLIIFRNRAEAP